MLIETKLHAPVARKEWVARQELIDYLTGTTANGSAIGNAGGLTEIIMIDNAGRDKDTVSSLSGGENFSATWLRSN